MSRENLTLDVESCPYVFVYGTLKRGKSNHHFLSGAEFIAEAVAQEVGTLSNTSPPSFARGEPKANLLGEIYKVDADTLRDLDYLEGHPNFYYRTQYRAVSIEDSEVYRVWCYSWFRDGHIPAFYNQETGAYEWN